MKQQKIIALVQRWVRTLAELRSIDSELERLSRTTDLIDEQETDSSE
jgi:hypothetical protein